MTHQQIYDATVDIYTELYSQATLRRNFVLQVRPAEHKQLTQFADYLLKNYREEEVTVELLIRYFEFQFSRYVGVQTKYGANSILLHWLIGKKALKTWGERNPKKNWLVALKCRKDFILKLNKAFASHYNQQLQQELMQAALEVNKAEEIHKKRYLNQPEGLVWCGTYTTLYNPASVNCQQCIHQQHCSKLLLREYPKKHKLRITAWQNKQ